MAKPGTVLAIDQGTTSTRAIVFGADGASGARAARVAQHYPATGWVEHDPEDIWRTTVETARQALAAVKVGAGRRGRDRHHQPARDLRHLGTAHGRRSTAPSSGRTGARRRSAAALKRAGHEPVVTAKTGLLLDPYFSATKIAWMLDNVQGARALAKAGELAFGTIDSWLIWRLTGGQVHATDATNASRTLLFDIAQGHLGRRSARAVRRAALAAARGARLRRRLWR